MENITNILYTTMRDPLLRLSEKTLYSYLLLHTPGTGIPFHISKDETLRKLGIGESRYKVYINSLIEKGYILREQENNKTKGNGFSPVHFTILPRDCEDMELPAVPTPTLINVLEDPGLSPRTKAVYIYLCVNDLHRRPVLAHERKEAVLTLGIASNTLTKHLCKLNSGGYIQPYAGKLKRRKPK